MKIGALTDIRGNVALVNFEWVTCVTQNSDKTSRIYFSQGEKCWIDIREFPTHILELISKLKEPSE